jgi:hypothetical protein
VKKSILTLCLVLLPVIPSAAQTVTGTLLGSVLDSSGALIPNAEVTAVNQETGLTRTVRSDGVGNYLLTFLPPGSYRLIGSMQGFRQTVQSGIAVQADTRTRVDLTLTVGETSETVEVVADIPLVQTSDATVGEVVDSQRITDLPLNKRNFMDLVQLTAGVAPGRASEAGNVSTIDNFRGRFTFNANGQRSTTNNIMVDGVDNNANLFNAGGVVIAPNVDAIAEFKVSTANFSPEFGRAAGGVVSVQTKSGTNQIHGTLFHFFRNSSLDSNTFFNNRAGAARPDFRQNQFGFTVGGPIRKNRTFFFGDYQGFRVREGNTFLPSVPTPESRQGDFSGPGFRPIFDPATAAPVTGGLQLQPFPGNRVPSNRFDPLSQNMAALYPLPNTNLGSIVNNYLNNPKLIRDDDQYSIRIDHRFSDMTNLFARYTYADASQLWPNALLTPGNPFGGGGRGNDSLLPAQALAINLIHTISPSFISETRGGFTRSRYIGNPLGFGDPLFDGIQIPNHRYSDRIQTIPTINITRLSGLGPQGNVPNVSVMNSFQVAQNFVRSVGLKHTIKFGGDFIRRQLNNDFTGNPAGVMSFTGSFTSNNARVSATTGEPFADFLLGYYNNMNRDVMYGGFGRRNVLASAYFQDDMKLTRRLTVNLGVRWDLWTPHVEVADRQASFDFSGGRFVQASPGGPLGRALRATDWNNLAPRFGFAYDLTGDGNTVLRGGYTISYIEDLSAGRTMMTQNPPFTFGDQLVFAQGEIPRSRLSDGFNVPVIPPTDERLAGVVRGVEPNYRSTYSQSFSMGIQRYLGRNFGLDIAYVGTKGTKLMQRVDGNQPVPGVGAVNNRRPFFSAFPLLGTIDGLQSSANSSFHSFQAKVTRRYSNGFQFLATYTWGRALEGSEGVGETGVGAPIPTMPQDANNRRAEKALASFHMLHRAVFSYSYDLPFGKGRPYLQSGAAAMALGGWSLQGVTSLLSGNPFTVQMAASNLNTGTAQRPDRICDGNLPSSERTVDRWFDPSCFQAPAAFTFGNAGRNILIGPGAVNFDFGVLKNIPIREVTRLEFRAEAFNLMNTPQFYPPNGAIGNPNAGFINGVRGGSNRQIQFALKLIF